MPTQTAATDAELVARAADGEQEAFTALFERYVDHVHDHVARWSRDATLAADATQEAFVALLRNLETLRDGQAVLAWLLRTARNRAIDQLRRTRAETALTDARISSAVLASTRPDAGASPEDVAITHETAAVVWEVAAGLDDRTFSVLDLSVRQELSGPEIAEVMDTTPSNANVLVHRMRERMDTLLGAALLLQVPMRDCATLEALRAAAPDPVDLPAARRIRDHADECVTCGPRRARAVAPLRTYGAFAQVRAPVAVRTAVQAAAATHFATAGPSGPLRRGAVAAAVVGLLLLVGGIANGLRAPAPEEPEGPPAVAAEPVAEPTPGPTPTATLDALPPAAPLPAETAAPSPSPTATSEPSPSPSPDPSPSPVPLAVRIEEPAPGTTVVADRDDSGTARKIGTVAVRAVVEAQPEAEVILAWTTDLDPDTVLLAEATGQIDLWLEVPCQDTTHPLRVTATDTRTDETATTVVEVTMTHTCPEVTIERPEDGASVPATSTGQEPGEDTYAATFRVEATSTDPDVTWTWTSDQMPGEVLLRQSSGEVRVTGEGCGGEPVAHVLTATAERPGDRARGSDQVTIEVVPPECSPL